MNITAGKNFAVTKTEQGVVIEKLRRPEPTKAQEIEPAPEPFDLSSLHYYTSVTGEDQVTVSNMRVYYSTGESALNFYDDEDENITGFDPDTTYYLYVESENRVNAGNAGTPISGDSSDPVTIPGGGTSEYVFNSSTAIHRPVYLTYKDIEEGVVDEIHIVKYDEVPEDTPDFTRWLIATVRRNGEDGPITVRQKHLGALFIPGDTLLVNPIADFSVTLL